MHPEYPPEGIPRARLEARYGEGFHSRVQLMIEEAGFTYDPPEVVPNSTHSLELAELARDSGQFRELHLQLFKAYWSENLNIGDTGVLKMIGSRVGLDPGGIDEVFADGRYKQRIGFTTESAHNLGIGGTPTWLIDDELLVSGAQPHQVFEQAMSQLGHKND